MSVLRRKLKQSIRADSSACETHTIKQRGILRDDLEFKEILGGQVGANEKFRDRQDVLAFDLHSE